MTNHLERCKHCTWSIRYDSEKKRWIHANGPMAQWSICSSNPMILTGRMAEPKGAE